MASEALTASEAPMARSSNPDGPHGLAIVDKPAGWTSHDVVARSRKVLGTRRVGHAGTLDPDATGVLVLGVGKVTRLLRFLSAMGKSYVGEIVFGIETNTLDSAGEVTARHDMTGLSPDAVAAATPAFVGPILQIPPMVSALKVDGKRLHELARAGIEVERQPRPVTVHALAIVPTADSLIYRIEATCSSGTYVRTLAADIGTALGGGAHLRNLRRTSVGAFCLADVIPLEELNAATLQSPANALRHLPALVVSPEEAVHVAHGRRFLLAEGSPGGQLRLLDDEGQLLAVAENEPGTPLRFLVVMAGPEAVDP